MSNATRTFIPSPQQQAFLDWCQNGTGSANLIAVAGSGKTRSILEAIPRIAGQVAVLAFNKKIAEEISEKLVAAGIDWKKAQAGTVHSFGFKAFRKRFPQVKVDGYKVRNLVADYFTQPENEKDPLIDFSDDLGKLVSFAKQAAIGVVAPIGDRAPWQDIIDHFDLFDEEDAKPELIARAIDVAIGLLRQNNSNTDVIDFDDMIYLTLVRKCPFWQVDVVFVDEAQDQNAARRALVRALVKPNGRVIAVGDPKQCVNSWCGADSNSLELTAKDFNSIELPLTVSYRCPKKVVEFAHQWVSHIQAHPDAIEGSVSSIQYDELFSRKDLDGDAAILCRLTAPLVETAFKLIRHRIPCKVEGRDIGSGLTKLATRWSRVKTINALNDRLDAYLEKERVKFLAKKQEQKVQALEDRIETLKVIGDACRADGKHNVSDIVSSISSLFADDVRGLLTLSTIHKSKGREFLTVFWLDRAGTCPSRWAKQDWQKEAELCLQYVAATRAKENLIDIVVPPKARQGK